MFFGAKKKLRKIVWPTVALEKKRDETTGEVLVILSPVFRCKCCSRCCPGLGFCMAWLRLARCTSTKSTVFFVPRFAREHLLVLHVSDGSLHPYSNLFHPWSFNRIQQKFTYGSLNRELDVQVASAWTEEVGQSSASSWVFVNGSNSGGFTATNYCWWMKSGVHQLRLVVYPIIYIYLPGSIHPPGGVGFQPTVVTLTM